jgi:hypothetical protein
MLAAYNRMLDSKVLVSLQTEADALRGGPMRIPPGQYRFNFTTPPDQ